MITFSADQIIVWTLSVIWPFFRISAMLLVAPVFGAKGVTARMRMGLAFLLTLVIAPNLPAPPMIDALSMQGLIVAIHQVLIGIAMGLILQMVFSALVAAGETVSISMGLSFAQVADPVSGVQVPVVSQFFVIMGTLLFLAMNGHLVLLQTLILSFSSIPIGFGGIGSDDYWALLKFGTAMFNGALLIALPAVASMKLVNISLGVVGRAAPQLHLISVGFPMMILAGFILMSILLPAIFLRLGELLMLGFDLIQQLIRI